MDSKRILSLALCTVVCLLMLLPLALIWLLNLDVAVEALDPDWTGFAAQLPSSLRAAAEPLCVDFSTVSTLVPVLIVLFPLLMSIRILAMQRRNPDYIYLIEWDPYPPQFPFFLVMLGLTGTLYGLYIGLDVSGVAELGQASASAESIRATIDRLLDGTATALLSSLVGLIGAFLAARPLTWLFRRLAFIPAGEDHQPLSDTLSTLNRDLMELARSSRDFSERLNSGSLEGLLESLSGIRGSLESMTEAIVSTNEKVAGIAQTTNAVSERLALLEELHKLDHLRSMDQKLADITPAAASAQSALESLHRDQLQAFGKIDANERANGERIDSLAGRVSSLLSAIESIRDDAGGSRQALKKALSKYLESEDHSDE